MEKDKIQTILESHNVPLTDQKKSDLWYAIETDIQKLPIPSPFLFSFITKKSMASIIIALVLMLGASGSVYASNEARPGDILFPIDQAIERVRLSLTNDDETRARLQVTFAEERLTELRSILAERSDDNDDEDGTNNTSTSTNSFEAEADVFLNTTIVKVEINDRKTTFETSADTREEVIAEIVSRFGIDRATVDTALDFEIEDRDSQIKDITDKITSSSFDNRIATAIRLIEKSLDSVHVDEAEKSRILAALITDLYGVAERVRIDDDRIEIRSGNDRVEIRNKKGETEIRIKNNDKHDKSDDDSNDNDSDDSDDNDDEDGTNNTSTSTNSFEAEADVFLNTTIVKVEINDRKTTFETSADTREEVIAEIVSRFGIDRATVDTALDFEIEDRDSQDDSVSDSNDNEDDSNDDQSSNDDSDDNAKIEVRVEDGVAEVRMEYNGKVDEFESSYTTRATLIVQLALRSGLTQSVISDNLDLEVKD